MNIFHIITQGVLFGFTLSLMIGPAFFKLIQTSISKGFISGSHMAIGVSISDMIMVFTAWYGLSGIIDSPKYQKIAAIVGGIIIICFGIYTATRRHVTTKTHSLIKENTLHLKYLGQGFIFNIANPSTWLFWLIPIGMANAYSKVNQQILFLITILITNLSMDFIKCAIANELKKFLTDNVITIINRVVGAILIAFGIYLSICYFLPNGAMPSIMNN